MKPQQPDVAYCIKNAEFVNGLREGRGWQEGDWFIRPLSQSHPRVVEGINHADVMNMLSVANEIWIPTSDDVLGMLGEALPRLGEGDYGWALEGANDADRYQARIPGYLDEGTGFLDEDIYRTDGQKTPLIALLELLRAVEGTG